MAFPTSAEVKVFLGITASTYDTLIAALLPCVVDDIKEYCNNEFLDTDGTTDIFPVGGKPAVAHMIGYYLKQADGSGGVAGVTSFSEGGYSETRSNADSSLVGGYPKEIMTKFDKWKYIRTSEGSITQHWRDKRGLFYAEAEYILPDNTDDE